MEHKVKIINSQETLIPTDIYIDDVKVGGVREIEYFKVGLNQSPTFHFEVVGMADLIEIQKANVEFQFTSKTLQEASKILQDELKKHGDLYNAFLASIESSLLEHCSMCVGKNSTANREVAEKILKRIIGEE